MPKTTTMNRFGCHKTFNFIDVNLPVDQQPKARAQNTYKCLYYYIKYNIICGTILVVLHVRCLYRYSNDKEYNVHIINNFGFDSC